MKDSPQDWNSRGRNTSAGYAGPNTWRDSTIFLLDGYTSIWERKL